MGKVSVQERVNSVLAAMLWPFGALMLSLRDIRSGRSKVFFFIFCLWIGAIFIFNDSSGSILSARVTSNDGYAIALQFYEAHSYNGDFASFFKNRDLHDSMDFFQITSIYYLSRLTDNPRLWFLYVALLYAFFYVSNIWNILSRCHKSIRWYDGLFVALLLFCIPITAGLNATRMNLAIQIYIYGLLPFLLDKDKKKLWVSFLCLLVHFSMFLPLIILLIFIIIPKKSVTPFMVFFIISFFIQQLDISAVQNILSYLPLGYEDRTGVYLDDSSLSYEEKWRTTSSFVYKLSMNIRQYICFIFMIFLFLTDRKMIEDSPWRNLVIFSLLLYSVANIVASLPSGYRFLRISNSLLIGWIILTLNNVSTQRIRNFVLILVPFVLYSVTFSIRGMLDYMGVEVLWGNFLTTIFVNDNTQISRILGLSI